MAEAKFQSNWPRMQASAIQGCASLIPCVCAAQFEDPTDELQQLRQSVEAKRALALPWLVNLSSGAIASVAAQHSHTHSSTGTVSGHPANENSSGHANGCVTAGEAFLGCACHCPQMSELQPALSGVRAVNGACMGICFKDGEPRKG